MIRSSLMDAVTSPSRWGYTPVDLFFGEVRERPDRVVVHKGELLRHDQTGAIVVFLGRQGANLLTTKAD